MGEQGDRQLLDRTFEALLTSMERQFCETLGKIEERGEAHLLGGSASIQPSDSSQDWIG